MTTPHRPIWADNSSRDPAAITAFYGGLFGWSFLTSPDPQYGGYSRAQLDGRDVRVACADARAFFRLQRTHGVHQRRTGFEQRRCRFDHLALQLGERADISWPPEPRDIWMTPQRSRRRVELALLLRIG